MEVANIMLALAGELGQTVPKAMVTPSEVAVLREIHGAESVFDIDPKGTVDRSQRNERGRLVELYGQMVNGERRAIAVERLFPGVAAPLFETFAQLELPTEFYRPKERVGAGTTAEERFVAFAAAEADPEADTFTPNVEPDPLDHDGDGEKGGAKKPRKKAEAAPVSDPVSGPEQPDDLGNPTGTPPVDGDDPLFN